MATQLIILSPLLEIESNKAMTKNYCLFYLGLKNVQSTS